MSSPIRAQLRKGVVEHCILGAISGRPMYGWELAEQLIGAELIASIGTLYPVLTRLRERGLITEDVRPAPAGPVRKYYRLTRAGARELDEFRATWRPFVHAVEEMIDGR